MTIAHERDVVATIFGGREAMGYPLDLIWLTIPAYIVLQVVVIWRSTGASRGIAALPMLVMVPVFLWTGIAYAQEHNLWPLGLIFASPVALLYVLFVLCSRVSTKHSTPSP